MLTSTQHQKEESSLNKRLSEFAAANSLSNREEILFSVMLGACPSLQKRPQIPAVFFFATPSSGLKRRPQRLLHAYKPHTVRTRPMYAFKARALGRFGLFTLLWPAFCSSSHFWSNHFFGKTQGMIVWCYSLQIWFDQKCENTQKTRCKSHILSFWSNQKCLKTEMILKMINKAVIF